MTSFVFEAIGTHWQIDLPELTSEQQSVVRNAVLDRIDIYDKTYSRFRADSLVTKISQETGTFTFPEDGEQLFALYRDLYDRTDGLVTPLIGNLIADAGYDANYSFQKKDTLAPALTWDEVMEYTHPNLVVKKPVLLDVGAAGKGYLIDLVAVVLEDNGITEYCIDAGGDILQRAETPMRIGLEDPDNTDQVIGVYELTTGSICGSAGTRRAWGDYTHIINPKTLVSPRHISAVWVMAETALIADALATCLFFVDPEILTPTYTFDYVIVYTDRSIKTSTHFPGELFIS